jgi:hypothetical protein
LNQHFEGRKIGEAPAAQDEVVNAEFDEWLHLFDDLGGSTGEGISRANAGFVQGLDGVFSRAADAATDQFIKA